MSAGIAALGAGASYLADSMREDRKEAEDKRRWEAEHARQLEIDAVLKALREQQIAESQAGTLANKREAFTNRARLLGGQQAGAGSIAEAQALGLGDLLDTRGGQAGELPSRSIMGATGLPGGTTQAGGISKMDPLQQPGASYFRKLILPEEAERLGIAREGLDIDRGRLGLQREGLGLDRDKLALEEALGRERNAIDWARARTEADWRKDYGKYYSNRAAAADPRMSKILTILNTAMGKSFAPGDALTGTPSQFSPDALQQAWQTLQEMGITPEELRAAVGLRTEGEMGGGLGPEPPGVLNPSSGGFWRR